MALGRHVSLTMLGLVAALPGASGSLAEIAQMVRIGLGLTGTNSFGRKFLKENKEKEDVITLESGLQYKVLREGTGIHYPEEDSPCECHYEGRTAQEWPSGTKFDSSYDRGEPATFAPSKVIKGWTEAMQLMVEGDKWEMYIPSELGYGDSGSPPSIGGGDVLVFTMELLKINGAKMWFASKCDVKTLAGCRGKETGYVKKMKDKGAEHIESEMNRLKSLSGGKMNDDQVAWLKARFKLLEKLNATRTKDEL